MKTKKLRLIFICSLSLFCTVFLIYRAHQHFSKTSPIIDLSEKKEWETFHKHQQKIVSHPSSKKELEQIQQPPTPHQETHSATLAEVPRRFGRQIMGENGLEYDENAENPKPLVFINHFNPEWKDMLGEYLLKFQEVDTKVFIQRQRGLIKLEESGARLVEEVLVNYLRPQGGQSSFKALIDSQSGEIIQTWNKTVHEDVGGENRILFTLPVDD